MARHLEAARTLGCMLVTSLALGGCATKSAGLPAHAPSAVDEAASEHVTAALGAGSDLVAPPGKVVVVAFYATWCPAARKMLRSVATLAARSADRELVVMGVAEDEDVGAAQRFANGVGLTGPITVDTDGALARRLGLETVPALVVIGKDGVVRRIHAGYRGEETDGALGREVAALLHAPRPQDPGEAVAAAENER